MAAGSIRRGDGSCANRPQLAAARLDKLTGVKVPLAKEPGRTKGKHTAPTGSGCRRPGRQAPRPTRGPTRLQQGKQQSCRHRRYRAPGERDVRSRRSAPGHARRPPARRNAAGLRSATGRTRRTPAPAPSVLLNARPLVRSAGRNAGRKAGLTAALLNEWLVTWTWRSKYTPGCAVNLDPNQSLSVGASQPNRSQTAYFSFSRRRTVNTPPTASTSNLILSPGFN